MLLFSEEYKPIEVNPTCDLNQDGIADVVLTVEEDSKTQFVPMYGVMEGDNLRYVPAEEMQELFPNSKADYDSIADRLND